MPAVKRRTRSTVNDAETAEMNGAQSSKSMLKPRRNLRGRRGVLQELPNMPLDILFEVFSHMHPLDLLNLCRTSKSFRQLLMDKTSVIFWKAARKNVDGLPQCPSFMSEPAFANLLFCSNCHNCLKVGIKSVLWAFRARYCNDCKHTMTISQGQIGLPGVNSWDPSLSEALPMITDRGKARYMDAKSSLRDVEALKELVAPASGDVAKVREILVAQKPHVTAIRQFAVECALWYENRKESRSQELDEIRRGRLMAVVEKLRELGWGEELDVMAGHDYVGLSRLNVVRQAKALTDRTWANIRKTVEEHMAIAKAARLLVVRKALLKERLKLLQARVHTWRQTFDGLFPHVRDFAALPEVVVIVDAPSEVSVTTDSFDILEPILPELVDKWRKSAEEALEKNLKSYTSECDGDVEPLSLAKMVLFSCQRCRAARPYPEMLTHCCHFYGCFSDEVSGDVYHTSANSAYQGKPWNPSNWRPVSAVLGRLVDLCNKEPARTTSAEMDAFDARFVCEHCDTGGVMTVMTWRTAAHHVLQRHGGHSPSGFKLANNEHSAAAKTLELAAADKTLARLDMKLGLGWCCPQCPFKQFESKRAVTNHLAHEHGKTEGYTDADYYRHPDSPPQFPDPVYLVSDKKNAAFLPQKISTAKDHGLVAFREDIPNLSRGLDILDNVYDFGFDHYADEYGMEDDFSIDDAFDESSDEEDGYGYGFGFNLYLY
ncbi:hypothetical protein BXZ70DRAFT_1009070 [Cristinia sonorae]|uniref:F-box domain-containing protein n=1 Tax=Cristinia sonorae TaxID=1940300 RepID=A0A8K0UM56_9AGAR|nr:hypothetical protein BXZ70DRAFT_1009070 [Cristinia sonorae]